MNLALEMGAYRLKENNDSQLVSNQVSGKYQVKEPKLLKYMQKVHSLSSRFTSFEIEHVPCKQNFKAELLSKLATSKTSCFNRKDIYETLASPIIELGKVYFLGVVLAGCCSYRVT